MGEQIETPAGTPAEVAPPVESDYSSVLTEGQKGEGAPPEESPEVKPPEEQEQTPEKPPEKPEGTPETPFLELVVDEGQKLSFKTEEEFNQFLEKNKTLNEGFMRQSDYTKKTTEVSSVKKSFVESFGRVPEPRELQALGKIYQAWSDPKYQEVLSAIINDRPLPSPVSPAEPLEPEDPVQKEIRELRSSFEGYVKRQEGQEAQKSRDQAQNSWNSWKEGRETKGEKITEEIETTMGPTIAALDKIHPEWDDNKILDEALKRAKIINDPDGSKKEIVKETLQSADSAKKKTPLKTTPTQPEKTVSESSYSELLTK